MTREEWEAIPRGNHLFCRRCWDEHGGGGEKSCGHGFALGAPCVACGRPRAEGDEPYVCPDEAPAALRAPSSPGA